MAYQQATPLVVCLKTMNKKQRVARL